jgi:hypothetical protein
VNGRSNVSLGRKPFMLESGGFITLFPFENVVSFERNTAYLPGFSSVRNITFVQKSSIQVNGRNTESLGRKTFLLEAGVSSTLFPCEN